jgi:hypothetical protein
VVVWMPRWQEVLIKPTATVVPTPTAPLLFDAQAGQVVGLQVVSAEGKSFDAKRDSATGQWVAPDASQLLDSTVVDESVNQLVGTTVLTEFEDKSDLSLYGLAPADATLTVSFQDGSQHVIAHGEVAPSGQGYYALIDNERLVLLSKYSLGRLLDFVDNPPLLAPTPTVAP